MRRFKISEGCACSGSKCWLMTILTSHRGGNAARSKRHIRKLADGTLPTEA